MKITAKQYAKALFESVSAAPSDKVGEVVKNFCRALKANNQTSQLGKIIGQFEQIWDKKNNIVKAEIISALKLNSETEKIIEQYLKKTVGAKEIELSRKVDKNILGGVIIKYGDRILDESLRTRLAEFSQTLKG
ncbi:MAG: ATP synthase F1 subunit delta [Patescibacteria group bacterium]|nr:ATP synthase F1 subunit delta [Patescibacteria group bacterium]